jgi:drug/metabolite transporter (DMT)-like permease
MDGRRTALLLALATALLLANQLAFVYSLKLTDATTVSLILGTTPMFTALISSSLGVESLTPTFWIATVITFGGVALVALGNGGSLSADIVGDLIALALAATWGAYSVTITPLMETFSPYRISSVVLLAMGIPLVAISVPQLGAQDYGAPNTLSWLGLAYAIVGPLALTNILWFMAISRVGPARASLFANLQPFLGAVFALVLLSEDLGPLQVAGGFLIAGGVMLERRTHRAVAPVAE